MVLPTGPAVAAPASISASVNSILGELNGILESDQDSYNEDKDDLVE